MTRERQRLAVFIALIAVGCTGEADGTPPLTGGNPDAHLNSADGAARPGQPDAGHDAGPDAALPCVEGADRVSDPGSLHCHILFTDAANWATARATCDSLGPGVHLATITDPSEFAAIQAMLGSREAWLGGNDLATEGVFEWDSGEEFLYTNWRSGEPNNAGNEDCIVVQGNQAGRWDDRPCGMAYSFLCERD